MPFWKARWKGFSLSSAFDVTAQDEVANGGICARSNVDMMSFPLAPEYFRLL